MPTFPLIPGPPPPGDFQQVIVLGDQNPLADPCPGCVCTGLSALWWNGNVAATAITSDVTYPAFAISGLICPTTTYDLVTEWDPDADGGIEPTLTQFGASAWVATPIDVGIFTVNVTVHCEGVDTALAPLVLTVIADTYSVDCVAPVEYVNILTFANTGCIHAQKHGVEADIVFTVFDSFQINDGPFYQNPGTIGTITGINFDGLSELMGTSDMDVRVTVFSNDLANAGDYFIYVDNHGGVDSADVLVAAGATWEYTVANADLNDWYTGAGCGNGAGGTGGCEFQVEIKVHV